MNYSNDDLEDELENAFKTNEDKKNVFSIIRKEKESLDIKDKRTKIRFKS